MYLHLAGIHHVTAVSARIKENHHFYTQTLGMRLVKRSVNQDDVRAYHLFYADKVGTPGTDLTFFDWNAPREKRGTNSVTRTLLRVTGEEALRWWDAHLRHAGVTVGEIATRDNRRVLDFEDGEGQRLALIDDGGAGDASQIWERSPVPPAFQIRGLGPAVMSVPDATRTELVLTQVLNMRFLREYTEPARGTAASHTVRVFGMGGGEIPVGPHSELHVAVQPDLPRAHPGAGGVHHIAFRTPNDAEYEDWAERLNALGIPNSGAIDRYYFRSLYFREPGHILFEIATDGPGFGVDEDPATLGDTVVLPPFLESRRAEIVANLKPID